MRSSCEHLLNLRKRSLVEHELLRIEDVVHIDEVGKGGLDAGQVAGGEDDVLVGLSGHDQSLAVGVDCAQETGELLGLDLVHLDLVDEKMASRSNNSTPNRVRTLLFPAFGKFYMKNAHPAKIRYGMPKSWFLDRAEYDFEGHKFYGTKDYDAFLKYLYNDYMTLPPKEKRPPHAPVSSFNFNVQSKSVDREKVK